MGQSLEEIVTRVRRTDDLIAEIATASGEPNRNKVGKVTKKQVLEIAKAKQADLNAKSDEAACRIIAGTARSMGIDVVD